MLFLMLSTIHCSTQKLNEMKNQATTQESVFIDLQITKTTRSKDTEKITRRYIVKDSLLTKTEQHWGVHREQTTQELPLSEKHYQDLTAYLGLSWENLEANINRPPIKGNLGKTYAEVQLEVTLNGATKTLTINSMTEEVVKDIHYLSANLLSEYLDKYFVEPQRFRALEWTKEGN